MLKKVSSSTNTAKKPGAGDLAQQQSACLVSARSWVRFSAQKTKTKKPHSTYSSYYIHKTDHFQTPGGKSVPYMRVLTIPFYSCSQDAKREMFQQALKKNVTETQMKRCRRRACEKGYRASLSSQMSHPKELLQVLFSGSQPTSSLGFFTNEVASALLTGPKSMAESNRPGGETQGGPSARILDSPLSTPSPLVRARLLLEWESYDLYQISQGRGFFMAGSKTER